MEIDGIDVIPFTNVKEPFKTIKENNLVALLVRRDSTFILYLDNTNVFSSYADIKVTKAIERLSQEIKRKAIAEKVDPEIILNPIELEIKRNAKTLPSTFLEIMYSLLIPFILLLPTFLATNMVTDSIIGEKEKRTYELLISAPIMRRDIILGKAIPVVMLSKFQALLWVALLRIRGIVIYNLLYVIIILLFLL